MELFAQLESCAPWFCSLYKEKQRPTNCKKICVSHEVTIIFSEFFLDAWKVPRRNRPGCGQVHLHQLEYQPPKPEKPFEKNRNRFPIPNSQCNLPILPIEINYSCGYMYQSHGPCLGMFSLLHNKNCSPLSGKKMSTAWCRSGPMELITRRIGSGDG